MAAGDCKRAGCPRICGDARYVSRSPLPRAAGFAFGAVGCFRLRRTQSGNVWRTDSGCDRAIRKGRTSCDTHPVETLQTRRGNEAIARRRPHVPRNRSHPRPPGFHHRRHGRRPGGTRGISISAALGEPRSLRSNRRGLRAAWSGAAQDPEGRPAFRGYVRRNPAGCGATSAAASSGVCGNGFFGRVTQTKFPSRSRASARILRKTLRALGPQQRLPPIATAGDGVVTQSVVAFETIFHSKARTLRKHREGCGTRTLASRLRLIPAWYHPPGL